MHNIRTTYDNHIDTDHLCDMALHIWGEDSKEMMKTFEPSDAMLTKYDNSIVKNEKAIRGQRVLDLGCNHGLYSYMAMRHGASHVVGVEPRGMFVDGLNAFSDKNNFPMKFYKAYDTDLANLVQEHNIDTVIMMSMDTYIPWEERMYDLRRSDVKWIILQLTSLPKTWMQMNKEISDNVKAKFGLPVGFTLHYESHNVDTRAVINPLHRDKADPTTGFQHIGPDGEVDLTNSHFIRSLRSRDYISKFIDHAGFTVDSTHTQDGPIPDQTSVAMAHGVYQWYLLHNDKQG